MVKDYHQPLDVAWRFTFKEFMMLIDLKKDKKQDNSLTLEDHLALKEAAERRKA